MTVNEYIKRPNVAKFPFTFIVTFGRSGSTLLQGIINSIPGYCVRGENYSTLFYLFVATQMAEEARKTFGKKRTSPKQSWYGADQLDTNGLSRKIADAFLDSCLKPSVDTKSIGFKEIRFLPSEIPDELFESYLDFIQEYFPGAAFIFNVRDLAETSLSGWWRSRDPAAVKEELTQTIERFEAYAAKRPNCIVFSYDSLIADAAYCKRLFDFLGEPFNHELIIKLLAQPHGFMTRRQANETASQGAQISYTDELSVESAQVGRLRRSVAEQAGAINELKKENVLQASRIQDLRSSLQNRDQKIIDLKIELEAIKKSRSWSLTLPLRKLSQLLHKAVG